MRVDEEAVETKRFDYRFSLGARDGSEYYFEGYKVVRSDAELDLWRDTTRLYVDIGKGAQGPARARRARHAGDRAFGFLRANADT